MAKRRVQEQPFNFYGIRRTKNKKYYSVSLTRGDGNNRQWINVPIKAEHVHEQGNIGFIRLLLLEKSEKAEEQDDLPF